MAPTPESEAHKRKRDADDAGLHPGRSHQTSPAASIQSATASFINYLPRPETSVHLTLIEGDGDTFGDILGLIAEYESALDRQESLAATLGAKLTGPRLLRGVEKFFDGPIKTFPTQQVADPISWLDVVSFARSHPKDFTLTQLADGSRCCQFVLKGSQVEITEDDWRLIWSGALDRFPLEGPFEEDETAEMATLEILEQRTSMLYKKADEVAARARILNHRLGNRRQEIRRHRKTKDVPNPRSQTAGSQSASRDIHPHRANGLDSSYDLHSDLLQQFMAVSNAIPRVQSTPDVAMPLANVSRASPSSGTSHAAHWMSSHQEPYRSLITQSIDRIEKGDIINPPCDRCRRLRQQCTKHLTACLGCTKKHAKCSWKAVTDEEVEHLRTDNDTAAEREVATELPSLRDTPVALHGERQEIRRVSGDLTPRTLITEDGSRPSSRGDARTLTTLEPTHQQVRRAESNLGSSRTNAMERQGNGPEQWRPATGHLLPIQLPPMATTSTPPLNAHGPQRESAKEAPHQPSSSL